MNVTRHLGSALLLVAALMLAACGMLPSAPQRSAANGKVGADNTASSLPVSEKALDVVLYALGLVETGYRFGGKNPEAGLDCSGMVSLVFDKAAGLRLQGSAADLARQGKIVATTQLRPGDLVFFNTLQRPYSHVGIYIGEGRFVHAPSSGGKVRIDSLNERWFATRFEEARTYFD
ncbi:MAG: C40 family peptidase [Rhodocyclales bacterium]|nr:C40 family peptidase [Rhodocyclales bacterium]